MSSYNNEKGSLKKLAGEWWHHLKWHLYVWPAMGLIGWLLKEFLWPAVHSFFVNDPAQFSGYASAHPLRLFASLVVLLGVGALFKIWAVIRPVLLREKQYAKMLEGIGLREFSDHGTEAKRSHDWGRCVAEIEGTKPSRLCILGATGWETFGSSQSPLHGLVKDFQGTVSILLLKPGSDGFKRRTKALNKNEANYRQEIEDSVQYCRKLKDEYGKSIEVRLYEDDPIWKMIFSDRYLWLQYYDPSDDVDNTPVYTLQTRAQATDSSLYYPLVKVFLRRWNDSQTIDGETFFKRTRRTASKSQQAAA